MTKCFRTDSNIEENSRRFNKVFSRIVHKCFKKVRVRPKKCGKLEKMLKHLDKLKSGNCSSDEVIALELEIQEYCAEENAKVIKQQVSELSDLDGNFSPNLMWQVKKKVVNRAMDPPMAKRDNDGNLITAPTQLKKLYIDEYVHRLRHREIKASFETLKGLKEDLWERRFEMLSRMKSQDWTTDDVQKVHSGTD